MAIDILDRQTSAPAAEENKETTNSTVPEKVNVSSDKKDELVFVPKAQWEEVLATVKRLEDGGVKKIPKVKDRIAKICISDGKIVTKILKTWIERKFSEKNPLDQDRLFAVIVTEDNKEQVVDYLDFLNNAERLRCLIKNIDKKDVSVNHGEFLTSDLDPKGTKESGKMFNGIEAEDIESRTDDDFSLEIYDGDRKGEIIKLNHLALNL